MKPGTPGIVGERLTEAREARGLTKVALAKLVGVQPTSIAYYENETATPRPELAARIATQLNVPLGRLFRPARNARRGYVFFRSRAAATKQARTAASRLFDWLKESIADLEDFVELPPVAFPELAAARSVASLDLMAMEAAAQKVRRAWNMGDGPISNVVGLLENHGAVVARFALGAADLDAFSEWHGEPPRPYVVLGSDKDSAVRSRLDAAHELGHLSVHRYLSEDECRNPQNHRVIEDQAFRFGAAFLLPDTAFAQELTYITLDRLVTLKGRWKVSIGMMIKRIDQLGLLDSEGVKRLWINYSRRGWRQREPLDDQLPVEQPRLASMSVKTIVENTGESGQSLADRLQLAPIDLAEFFSLPASFFDDQSTLRPVVQLRPRPATNAEGVVSGSTADIVQFQGGRALPDKGGQN